MMKTKKSFQGIVLCLVILIIESVQSTAEEKGRGSSNKDVTKSFSEAKSQGMQSQNEIVKLKDLEPIAVVLMEQHTAMCEDYAAEVFDLCRQISALKNEGKTPNELRTECAKKSKLLHELASSALLGTEMPLETKMKLFKYLDIDYGSLSSKEDRAKWSAKRAVLVKFLLKTWNDADQLVSSLDFSDRPLLNVGPPDGRSLDTIKDPALRKKWEDAIAKNRAKNAKIRRMNDLKSACIGFAHKAEFYVTRCYQLPPYESEELAKLLDMYVKGKDVRDRILENVRKASPTAQTASQ